MNFGAAGDGAGHCSCQLGRQQAGDSGVPSKTEVGVRWWVLLHPPPGTKEEFSTSCKPWGARRGSLGPHPLLFKAQRMWKCWGSPWPQAPPSQGENPSQNPSSFPLLCFLSNSCFRWGKLETTDEEEVKGGISPVLTSGHTFLGESHPVGLGDTFLSPKPCPAPRCHTQTQGKGCAKPRCFWCSQNPGEDREDGAATSPTQPPQGRSRAGGAPFLLHH